MGPLIPVFIEHVGIESLNVVNCVRQIMGTYCDMNHSYLRHNSFTIIMAQVARFQKKIFWGHFPL